MIPEPSILDLRAMWLMYQTGEWVDVALLLRHWNGALWDLDGVFSGCELT